MLKIEQFETQGLQMCDLEDLAEDENVYVMYYYKGYKTEQYEIEPNYRIRSLNSTFKDKDPVTKERIRWSLEFGKDALIWIHNE